MAQALLVMEDLRQFQFRHSDGDSTELPLRDWPISESSFNSLTSPPMSSSKNPSPPMSVVGAPSFPMFAADSERSPPIYDPNTAMPIGSVLHQPIESMGLPMLNVGASSPQPSISSGHEPGDKSISTGIGSQPISPTSSDEGHFMFDQGLLVQAPSQQVANNVEQTEEVATQQIPVFVQNARRPLVYMALAPLSSMVRVCTGALCKFLH